MSNRTYKVFVTEAPVLNGNELSIRAKRSGTYFTQKVMTK